MSQSPFKILIVEDNPTDQELLSRTLARMDNHFEIRAVETCQQALAQVGAEIPDLILLDIYLPDKDGFYFLEVFRAKSPRLIPIFLVSAFRNEADKLKGLKLGATDFINKPINIEELQARVGIQIRLKKILDDQKWAYEKTNDGIKILYKELERKNIELKRLDELKDEFVNNVSHELRTPLTIIRESISQIVDGLFGTVNEKQNIYLNKSLTNIDRLRKIIDDLLDISKIEKGKMELFKENVNIGDIIDEVAENFAAQCAKKGLALNVLKDHDAMFCFADKEKIIQVLNNLVNNAFKFTDKGQIDIFGLDKKDMIEIGVRDTGAGIAEKDLSRLFSKFEQISRQTGPGEKGTGLGLAIARGIVDMHGGKIDVKSEPGRGTTFSFILPKNAVIDDKLDEISGCIRQVIQRSGSFSILALGLRDSIRESGPALEMLESIIKKSQMRQTDRIIRSGCVLYLMLPDTNRMTVPHVLKRIQRLIAESRWPGGGIEWEDGLTFMTVHYPVDGMTEQELMAKLIPVQGGADHEKDPGRR